MPCEQKPTQNPKKIISKKNFKTKQNTEMSDEGHSDSGFIILKSKKRQRNARRRGWHFDNVEASGDTSMKI